jgi:hypothetical protein
VTSPSDQIEAGLFMAHQGLADLREDYERAATEQAQRMAQIVNAEEGLRALVSRARRVRMPRHLQAGEACGPRRPALDLRKAGAVASLPSPPPLPSARVSPLPSARVSPLPSARVVDRLEEGVTEVGDFGFLNTSGEGAGDVGGDLVMTVEPDAVAQESLRLYGLTPRRAVPLSVRPPPSVGSGSASSPATPPRRVTPEIVALEPPLPRRWWNLWGLLT